jgi:hypothetical protein
MTNVIFFFNFLSKRRRFDLNMCPIYISQTNFSAIQPNPSQPSVSTLIFLSLSQLSSLPLSLSLSLLSSKKKRETTAMGTTAEIGGEEAPQQCTSLGVGEQRRGRGFGSPFLDAPIPLKQL